ncbi:hypothetical protein, partial [Bradyrhizobium sp.]|uniref:hypothetical protein n=1 Tax=Bradyrhizobium sp. TaxID=376 RepID=UPI0023A19764
MSIGIASHICQCLRLDQQALSFIATPSSAEAHDHRVSGAIRLGAPREQGITRRQKFEIIE